MSEQVMAAGGCSLGCDPEFFFTQKGKIIGAERVIPREGLIDKSGYYYGKLVRDGVQVELHTNAGTCRQGQGSQIAGAFRILKQHLKDNHTDVSTSFEGVVLIPKRELDQLGEDAKVLGCAPSFNYYDKKAAVGVKNPATYRKRSAGGHIHIGNLSMDMMAKDDSQSHGLVRERLVPLLDILLGNTCVLLDRDPRAAERRKHYGRAGEYRLPAHGVEYRTLSNFWLRSYPLMSFVMAVARQAVYVLGTTTAHYRYRNGPYKASYINYFDAERALLDCVHLPTVVKAINKNDLDLAWKNWEGVRGFIDKYVPKHSNGLAPEILDKFEYFAKVTQEKGLERWWKGDPVNRWGSQNGVGAGWESFIRGNRVRLPASKQEVTDGR